MQRGILRPPVTLLLEEGSKEVFCALAALWQVLPQLEK